MHLGKAERSGPGGRLWKGRLIGEVLGYACAVEVGVEMRGIEWEQGRRTDVRLMCRLSIVVAAQCGTASSLFDTGCMRSEAMIQANEYVTTLLSTL